MEGVGTAMGMPIPLLPLFSLLLLPPLLPLRAQIKNRTLFYSGRPAQTAQQGNHGYKDYVSARVPIRSAVCKPKVLENNTIKFNNLKYLESDAAVASKS